VTAPLLNVKDAHMKKYSIQLNFIVEAHSESAAEQKVWEFMKQSTCEFLTHNIVDWDFLEFIPSEGNENGS
jgi:hypothetical protein